MVNNEGLDFVLFCLCFMNAKMTQMVWLVWLVVLSIEARSDQISGLLVVIVCSILFESTGTMQVMTDKQNFVQTVLRYNRVLGVVGGNFGMV